MKEIENRIELVRAMRDQLLKQLEGMTIELEGLYGVQGVAYAENWDDAIIMIETLNHAANNPQEYEGYHV